MGKKFPPPGIGGGEKYPRQIVKYPSSLLPRAGLCRHFSLLLPALNCPISSNVCSSPFSSHIPFHCSPVFFHISPSVSPYVYIVVNIDFFPCLSPLPTINFTNIFQQRHHMLFSLVQILVHDGFPSISELYGIGTGQFIAFFHKRHPRSCLPPNPEFYAQSVRKKTEAQFYLCCVLVLVTSSYNFGVEKTQK